MRSQVDSFPQEEQFHFEGNTYTKVCHPQSGEYSFFLNGQRIDVYEWNKVVNRYQPMSHKATHPNRLVRLIEKQRWLITRRLVHANGSAFLLDIGCESGTIASSLVLHAGRLIFVDVDKNALASIQKDMQHQPIFCLAANIYELPFADRTIDRILCTEVLEHLVDPRKAAREIERVLKPGGRVVISVPNDRLILWVKKKLIQLGLRQLLGNLSPGLAMGHLHVFKQDSLKSLFSSEVNVIKCFYNFPWFTNLFFVADKK